MSRLTVLLAWILLCFGIAIAAEPPKPDSPIAAASPTASPPLTPEQMYIQAMKAMKGEAIPPYVQFREDVAARNVRISCGEHSGTISLKHGDMTRVSRVSFRSQDGAAVSVDEASGQRCGFSLLYPAGAGLNALDSATPAPAASVSPGPGDDGLKMVGAVRVESARFYKITLAGHESIGGHPVEHLHLAPYRDPNAHPLTDLWIDSDSYLVRQARGEAAAHFVVGSGRFEGTLTFDRIGGYWIVRDEDFSAAANALMVHVRTHLAAHGSDFSFPDDLAGVFPSPAPTDHPSPSPHR